MRLTVCRGCCCGTAKARPDIDHAAQLSRLADLAREHGVPLRQSDCLGPCEDADVVVIHPSPAARAAGSRPIWLGRVGEDQVEALGKWVEAGGPGLTAIPEPLGQHILHRRQP